MCMATHKQFISLHSHCQAGRFAPLCVWRPGQQADSEGVVSQSLMDSSQIYLVWNSRARQNRTLNGQSAQNARSHTHTPVCRLPPQPLPGLSVSLCCGGGLAIRRSADVATPGPTTMLMLIIIAGSGFIAGPLLTGLARVIFSLPFVLANRKTRESDTQCTAATSELAAVMHCCDCSSFQAISRSALNCAPVNVNSAMNTFQGPCCQMLCTRRRPRPALALNQSFRGLKQARCYQCVSFLLHIHQRAAARRLPVRARGTSPSTCARRGRAAAQQFDADCFPFPLSEFRARTQTGSRRREGGEGEARAGVPG